MIELRRYRTLKGRIPFSGWYFALDDRTAGRIGAYIERMKLGHFGHSKYLGEKLFELKIHFGPGYRVYYLIDGRRVIVLLCGGNKKSQEEDIRQARAYVEDYWSRT